MRTRRATPDDVALLAVNVADGFESYRTWAPSGWAPPAVDDESLERLAERLRREDVWCLIALDGGEPAGHVAISPVTTEEPAPPPPGAIYLWQMFVGGRWRGTGLARGLMASAVAEAGRRGFEQMLLWTPRGAARARRFYEREGWTPTGRAHEQSHSGLATLEYGRAVGLAS